VRWNPEGDARICTVRKEEGNTIWRVIFHIGEAWFVDSRDLEKDFRDLSVLMRERERRGVCVLLSERDHRNIHIALA
jgi:hypothetical protein